MATTTRAEPLAELGRTLDPTADDRLTQALWRQVQALDHASRGDHAQAEALARGAVAVLEPTDALNMQADALCDLAKVFHASGRSEEAAAALEQAFESYGRKKNLSMAAQVRALLAALHEAPASA